MKIEMSLDDLKRLIALAEIGANSMSGESRITAIQRVRRWEAIVVTNQNKKD